MKKWTKAEIATIGSMELQGPIVEAFLQDLMRNQTEIIEELERIHKLLYHSELLPK